MDERTTEILKRFNESWTATEEFYDDLIDKRGGFDHLKPLRDFIHTLKQNGENKFFRLGISVFFLVISRSVEYRLRSDQKWIRIEPINNEFDVVFRDGNNIYRRYRVDSLNDIRVTQLLQTLKSTLID